MQEETSSDVQNVDELMQRITEVFDTLPRQLKSVATYIEQHRSNVMMDRTSDIAAACGVHPSAVVRFAQRFGFSGFSDLQAVFKQAYTGQSGSPQSYQQRIRKLIDEKAGNVSGVSVAREFIAASRTGLDELAAGLDDEQFEAAVKMLQQAENIYVIGVRRSFAVASYIVYALQHTKKRVHLVSGFGGMYREQIRSVRKGDVVIAISFAPYGKETQYCVRAAQHHGAKTLVITDSQLSPLARHASAHLFVKEGSAFAFRSLTSTICLCQALFIALAYRLELTVEESKETGGYDD
ncbi:Predicted transcriptional regulator of the myo-inositol catabolic operon [Caballeronia glathei]|jgi:DNA-binding MurR/RpiR family transcriptional regulator|uniref:RpiR family transcriptional regulator n=1 Tax=Caballeronia glathei TaxID=60547 RepID=A0A069PCU9_9BURK|nr:MULTISPECIES: MurR/RpiR family transcriptional regulator [Burkholderiaceae]KDR38342.1 RpiR family transcriptional regulator [Caballeronia glathei]TCK43055.1 RpiR family transcriptional regulator [Paraburkholderia sp. BL8N3]CDY73642.1 Predicted transcriptional regulator of the myo-inositol catabolic operon [Caballeronia glathei]